MCKLGGFWHACLHADITMEKTHVSDFFHKSREYAKQSLVLE
jgi:hypothetical protein